MNDGAALVGAGDCGAAVRGCAATVAGVPVGVRGAASPELRVRAQLDSNIDAVSAITAQRIALRVGTDGAPAFMSSTGDRRAGWSRVTRASERARSYGEVAASYMKIPSMFVLKSAAIAKASGSDGS